MGEKCEKAFGLLGFCHYGHGRDPGDPDASARLRVEPHAPGRTAERTARQGLNLMSPTLPTEAAGTYRLPGMRQRGLH